MASPSFWLTLVVFAAAALVTGLIYGTMSRLVANGQTGALKALSSGNATFSLRRSGATPIGPAWR